MIPREFLDQVVRPNVAEFHANYGSLRHGYNAVAAADALVAHIFWYIRNAPAQGDDTAYRATLASQNHDFRLLRDIAKAQKHVTQRSEEHTSELQSPCNLVCRLLLANKKDISNVVTDAASGVVDIFHGIDKAVADTWNNFWKDGKADGIGSNLSRK